MNKLRLLFVSLVAIVSCSTGQIATAADPSGTVTGAVTQDGTPVANVSVMLRCGSGSFTTQTNANGVYTALVNCPGRYEGVFVSAATATSYGKSLGFIKNGQSITVNVTLASTSPPPHTTIMGTINQNDGYGPGANGADVTVACKTTTKKLTADASGNYTATFPVNECTYGDRVTVTGQWMHPVYKKIHSGVAVATVKDTINSLNFALINVAIPEFGTIGIVVASAVGVGIIAATRRQQ